MSSRKILILGITLPLLGATVYSMKYAGKPCGGENAKSREFQCPRFYECVPESNEPNALGGCKFMPNGLKFTTTQVVGNEVITTPPQKDPAVEYDQQTQKAKRLALAQNKVGFELLKTSTYLDETNSQNIIISPVAVTMPLLALYGWSQGPTRDQMTNVLQIPGFSVVQLDEAGRILLERLNSRQEGVSLTLLDSLWLDDSLKLKQVAVEDILGDYGTLTETVDFATAAEAVTINNWVNGNTAGKISKVVPEQLTKEAAGYAVSAVYFKGLWRYTFNPENTVAFDFVKQNGETSKVQAMNLEHTALAYLENDLFKAVKLEYGKSGKYIMVVMVPKDQGLTKLLGSLDIDSWNGWLASFKKVPVRLTLPKFAASYLTDTAQIYKNTGLTLPFGALADFTPLMEATDPLKGPEKLSITSAPHATLLEIGEEGFGSPQPVPVLSEEERAKLKDYVDPVTFVINKPFFFAILDSETMANVFVGIVRSL